MDFADDDDHDSNVMVAAANPPSPKPPPVPPRNHGRRRSSATQIGNGLRRGGIALGRAVGDFFGVTEASQQGDEDNVGWEQVAQLSAEVIPSQWAPPPILMDKGKEGLMSLRRNAIAQIEGLGFRRRSSGAPPTDTYPLDINIRTNENASSFDADDISSDSEEETEFNGDLPRYIRQMSGGEGVDGTIPRLLNVMGTITEERSGTSVLSPVEEEREEFITDPQQAIAYFMEYMQAEQRVRERQNRQNALEFFGETFEDSIQQPPVQRRRMSSVGEPVVLKKNKGRKKLAHSNTKVREQVQSLPSFWPIFTVGITGIQIIVVIVLLSIRGLAPINIFPNTDTGYYPSLRNESGNASVSYYRYTNPWIGIGVLDLIQCGAKFTPCMRQDRSIIHRNLVQRATEGDMGGVGCCRNNIWIGSTLPDGCAHTWNPQNDTDYLDRTPCEDTSVLLANFHPCCIGITGQCAVMHVRECNDRGGIFFSNYQSCNETNCLNDICGFNGVGTVDGDPLQPVGGQIWRLVLSLFIHLGVIHVLIVAVIQLVLGIQIERTAGFVRIALIYFISGIGGNLVSAIFIPYQVNGGAAAAVFGLVGVLFVELFQSWQLIDRAWLELVKLTVVMVIMFAIGTLPFIDNLANIGGLLFGIPSAIIFLPYITFGKFDAWRKRILLIICIPILLLMFIVCLFIFIFVSDPNFCFFCHYFNCVPYTSTLCDNEVNSPDPEIVAL